MGFLDKLIGKKLFLGSLILLIGFNLYNFLNFLFQFVVARALSAADYGLLATLFSMAYLVGVISDSFQTVIAKYVADKQTERTVSVLRKYFKDILTFIVGMWIVYLAAIYPLSSALNIPMSLLVVNGFVFTFTLLLPGFRGVLQGKKRFGLLSGSLAIESSLKVLCALIAIYGGFHLLGVMGSVVCGLGLALAASYLFIKPYIRKTSDKFRVDDFYSQTGPILFATFVIVAIYSIDVILARAFFSEEVAGSYAVMSLLGKSIFWAVLPISKVMFPESVERSGKGEANGLLKKPIIAVCIMCSLILLVYLAFPETVFWIISGEESVIAPRALFFVGMGMSLLALSNLILFHKLGVGKIRRYKLLPVIVIVYAGILYAFSFNIYSFIAAFFAFNVVFLAFIANLLRK